MPSLPHTEARQALALGHPICSAEEPASGDTASPSCLHTDPSALLSPAHPPIWRVLKRQLPVPRSRVRRLLPGVRQREQRVLPFAELLPVCQGRQGTAGTPTPRQFPTLVSYFKERFECGSVATKSALSSSLQLRAGWVRAGCPRAGCPRAGCPWLSQSPKSPERHAGEQEPAGRSPLRRRYLEPKAKAKAPDSSSAGERGDGGASEPGLPLRSDPESCLCSLVKRQWALGEGCEGNRLHLQRAHGCSAPRDGGWPRRPAMASRDARMSQAKS